MLDAPTRPYRQMRTWGGQIVTVVFPTLTVLVVLAILEGVTRHPLLFTSLGSSAFLGHVDPRPGKRAVLVLLVTQLAGAILGLVAFTVVGPGYTAAGVAVFAVTLGMVAADTLHPPAVSTALAFAFKAEADRNLALFGTALAATAAMVTVGRVAFWLVDRLDTQPRGSTR
jgi:CBS-domain-containing membrane protein